MVAPQFPETDGRVDGAGRFWPNELPPTGNAPGAFLEKRGVGDSGQSALLRDRDAAAHRRVAAGRQRRSMAARLRSKAIRFIRRAAARRMLLRKLRFSISTIRRARSVSSSGRKDEHESLRRIARRAALKNISRELRTKMAADGGAGLAFLVEETLFADARTLARRTARSSSRKCAGAFTIRS